MPFQQQLNTTHDSRLVATALYTYHYVLTTCKLRNFSQAKVHKNILQNALYLKPIWLRFINWCLEASQVCTVVPFVYIVKFDLIKHAFEAHSLDATFRYHCGISSCTRVFTSGSSFDAFRGHFIRKYLNWQQMLNTNLEPIQDDEDQLDSTVSDCPYTHSE